MDPFNYWNYLVGIQGIATAASLGFSLYNFKKSKMCACSKSDRDVDFYSPLPSGPVIDSAVSTVRSSSTQIKLPKRKKLVKSNGDLSLVETIKEILEDAGPSLSTELKKIISSSMEDNQFTEDQCISALSYEFVGFCGSDKIQQADVELFTTIFSKSVNTKYRGYVEFIIVLKKTDKLILKAFEPKITLLSILLVTSDQGKEIDEKALSKVIKVEGLEKSKILSSISAITISKSSIEIEKEDVSDGIDTIKAAIVRRSSRIRKINK